MVKIPPPRPVDASSCPRQLGSRIRSKVVDKESANMTTEGLEEPTNDGMQTYSRGSCVANGETTIPSAASVAGMMSPRVGVVPPRKRSNANSSGTAGATAGDDGTTATNRSKRSRQSFAQQLPDHLKMAHAVDKASTSDDTSANDGQVPSPGPATQSLSRNDASVDETRLGDTPATAAAVVISVRHGEAETTERFGKTVHFAPVVRPDTICYPARSRVLHGGDGIATAVTSRPLPSLDAPRDLGLGDEDAVVLSCRAETSIADTSAVMVSQEHETRPKANTKSIPGNLVVDSTPSTMSTRPPDLIIPTPAQVEAQGRVVCVSDLTDSIADGWLLVGQVVSRQPVRQWNNVRGCGQLLSFLIVDAAGDTIKATVFNDGVPMFDTVLQDGAVCSFAGGKIKVPNRAFSTAPYEMSLDHRATVRALPEKDRASFSIPQIGTTVRELEQRRSDEVVSIVGIVIQLDPSRQIRTAKGKLSSKREFLVVDDSMYKVVCAVWGNQAQSDLDRYKGRPVFIERATVNDYQGTRSINVGVGATAHFEPTLPEAARLLSWFAKNPQVADFAFVAPP